MESKLDHNSYYNVIFDQREGAGKYNDKTQEFALVRGGKVHLRDTDSYEELSIGWDLVEKYEHRGHGFWDAEFNGEDKYENLYRASGVWIEGQDITEGQDIIEDIDEVELLQVSPINMQP